MHEYFCLHVSVCATCMPSAHRDQKTQALCKSNNVFLIAESSPQPQIPGYCSLNKLGLATHPNPSTGMASDENQSTSLCHLGQQPHLCHQRTDSVTKRIWGQPWIHAALSQHKEGPAFKQERPCLKEVEVKNSLPKAVFWSQIHTADTCAHVHRHTRMNTTPK